MELKLTKEEKKTINSLKKLSEIWPKSLWLFSASGTLCVMRYKSDGSRAVTKSGGMDTRYIVDSIDIPNDGGDW